MNWRCGLPPLRTGARSCLGKPRNREDEIDAPKDCRNDERKSDTSERARRCKSRTEYEPHRYVRAEQSELPRMLLMVRDIGDRRLRDCHRASGGSVHNDSKIQDGAGSRRSESDCTQRASTERNDQYRPPAPRVCKPTPKRGGHKLSGRVRTEHEPNRHDAHPKMARVNRKDREDKAKEDEIKADDGANGSKSWRTIGRGAGRDTTIDAPPMFHGCIRLRCGGSVKSAHKRAISRSTYTFSTSNWQRRAQRVAAPNVGLCGSNVRGLEALLPLLNLKLDRLALFE